jgi:glucose/arabinose dehydrogenase
MKWFEREEGEGMGAMMPAIPWSCIWQAAVATLVTTFAAIGAAHAQALSLELIASGLPSPVGLRNAGDGSNRLFIVNQGGTISVYQNGQVLTTPFLDVSSKVVYDGGERGLLGLAFDPNYATNGFFYIYYTSQPAAAVTISRLSVSANPNVGDPNSEVVLKTQAHSDFENHNGGSLLFGMDGCLYAGIGDGGSGGDPNNNAQNLGTLLAKIIRISPVDGTPCTAAPGNPFVNTPNARGEIWALGVRNPWRITMDRQTGDFWIADVGQNVEEEVDFQPPGVAGRNYCWSAKEGTLVYNANIPCTIGTPTDPIIEYDHSAGKCAIIGGYRYRGTRFPRLVGTYFYADLCTGQIFGATESGGVWTSTALFTSGSQPTTFGEDEAGELYIAHLSGSVHRLVFGKLARSHDFNGDGKSDIAWRDISNDASRGGVAIWEMNGTRVLNPSASWVQQVSYPLWTIIGLGDFNGDGYADFLWRDSSGDLGIWGMQGTQILNSAAVATVPTGWSVIRIGDFNGDGKSDLLWSDGNGTYTIWEMNGTTLLNSNATYLADVPTNWKVVGVGDFNGDGMSDILWQDQSGNYAIWEMNGTQIINPNGTFVATVPTNWTVIQIGDFNGDGKSDLLWTDGNGTYTIWEMNGTTLINQATTYVAIVTGWSVIGTGDYNGDGMSDILWTDGNGSYAIWEMSGTTILNPNANYMANVSINWAVQLPLGQ